MHAESKINTVLILSYWICSTILLVKGKRYPCIFEGQVPAEEFESNHYGELGYLRNVIVDVAQFMHKQMKLEKPLTSCKLLSKTRTSKWDFFHFTWKKKTRDKYGTEFSILEKKAELVLNDFIENAQSTPAFSIADQEALAKVIDLAKDRLLKSKTYTNEDSLIMNNLNKLRDIYCPKISRSSSEGVKSAGSQSDHQRIDKLEKPPPLTSTKFMSVESPTTETLILKHPATSNVPCKSSLISTPIVLPNRPLPSLKQQQKPDFGGYVAPKTSVLSRPPIPPVSSQPLSENGQMGSQNPPLSGWVKPLPPTNQALGVADGNSSGMVVSGSPAASQTNHVITPNPPQIKTGGTVKPQLPPSTSSSADPQSKSVTSSETGSSVQQNPKGPVFTPMSATNLIDDLQHCSEFESKVLLADKPVIVLFYEKGCYECRDMTPVLKDIVRRKQGELYLVRVDIEKLPHLTHVQNVGRVPHIKMFHNGMKIREETGFPGPTDLRKWVDDALPPPSMKPQAPLGTISGADPQSKAVALPETGSSVQQNSKGPEFTPMSASNLIDNLQHVDEFQSKVLMADKPVIVQFHAKSCETCEIMTPVLKDIVRGKQGEVYLVRVDTDKLFALRDRLNVKTLPHIKVFHNGRKIYEKTGYFGPTDLRKWAYDTLPSPPKS